jgi:hypothetical protein
MIDDELRSLGFNSNRKPQTLEGLIALLKQPAKNAAATRLLQRYTDESFSKVQQWEEWLKASQGRIFFTDLGGYKFLIVPPGYLTKEPQ